MTIWFPGDDPTPEDVLGATESLYSQAVVEFRRTISALRAGDMSEAKSAQAAIRDLRAMSLHLLDERNKVDKFRKQIAGHVAGSDRLDLDQARVEIGRRLACLRRAGGSG